MSIPPRNNYQIPHAYHQLAETEQQETSSDALTRQSQDPRHASQNLSQRGQNQQPCEQQRDGSTPHLNVDDTRGQLTEGKGDRVRDPITIGVSLAVRPWECGVRRMRFGLAKVTCCQGRDDDRRKALLIGRSQVSKPGQN